MRSYRVSTAIEVSAVAKQTEKDFKKNPQPLIGSLRRSRRHKIRTFSSKDTASIILVLCTSVAQTVLDDMSDSLRFTPHSRYSAAAQGKISSAVKRISGWLNNWYSIAAASQTSVITVLPLVIARKDGLLQVRQETVTGAGWRP